VRLGSYESEAQALAYERSEAMAMARPSPEIVEAALQNRHLPAGDLFFGGKITEI